MTHSNEITNLFESFQGKRVLIIGDVMIDAYLWGNVDRISPEAPVPVVALKKREYRLGGAANVALNIQGLGGVPILCSTTGQDEKGRQFHQLLEQQQMTTRGIISSPDRITTVKFRIMGNNMQMLRVDEEDQCPLSSHDTARLMEVIGKMISQQEADAIIFEDYDKGVITPELIQGVVDAACCKNIPILADPKKKNFLNYNNVTLLKTNVKELHERLKLDEDFHIPGKVEYALAWLQQSMNIPLAMVTLPEKGMLLSEKNPEDDSFFTEIIPSQICSTADRSGYDDTVISVAALCLAAGADPSLMAKLATLAGRLVCEHVGVVPVDKEKLLSEAVKNLYQ